MSYLPEDEQKLNEIIFATRNKNYGAYVIRSTYGETVLKALLLSTAFVAIALFTGYYLSNHPEPSQTLANMTDDLIYSVPVKFPEEKPVENPEKKPAATSPQKANDAQAFNNVISDTADVALTSTVQPNDGILNGEPTSTTVSSSTGSGTISEGSTTLTGTGSQIKSILYVTSLPEFEGGLSALYKFVALNTRFTSDALDAGIGGKIYVQFVVDEEGEISSIKLLNKLGYGLDEEAMRVVGIIPKFKSPAMVDGKPVKMYYQLPINFKIK